MSENCDNQYFRNSVFRVQPAGIEYPRPPISLYAVGHYHVSGDWLEEKQGSESISVVWTLEGNGELFIDGGFHTLPPGWVGCYRLHDFRVYKAAGQPWRYRWFSFDGSLAKLILEQMNFARLPFFVGTCPESLFDRLHQQLLDFTPDSILKAGVQTYELLTIISSKNSNWNDCYPPAVLHFIKLVEEEYSDPSFNVNAIAELLVMHRTTLNKLVHEYLKTTPWHFLFGMRLKHAARLLRESEMPIHEIATLCGISDPCYFSKLIKVNFGMSPARFRKKFRH